MNAIAQQPAAAPLGSPIDPVYESREDLALVYPPANHHDLALLNHAALAHQRLLRAYDMERQILATTTLTEMFIGKPDTFKALARHIAECERIYRRCIEDLERARRVRAKTGRAPLPPPEIRHYHPTASSTGKLPTPNSQPTTTSAVRLPAETPPQLKGNRFSADELVRNVAAPQRRPR